MSRDKGESWSRMNDGLMNLFVTTLAAGPAGDLYAGTLDGIYRSNDQGAQWTQVNRGLTNNSINAFAFDAGGDVFVATNGGGIFRLSKVDDTWQPVNAGLGNLFVMALAGNSMGLLIAGTNGSGVFVSSDGQSWQPVNEGLTNERIFSVAITSAGQAFAGTNGSGVFASFGMPTATEPLPLPVPDNFSLEQNFPNPFNPDTEIRFRLPARRHVKLAIYNLLGEEIRTLINDEYPAGDHQIAWDGKDNFNRQAPTGLYVFRLQAGAYIESRKMSLVR